MPIMTDTKLIKCSRTQASLFVIFRVMVSTHRIFSTQISVMYKNVSEWCYVQTNHNHYENELSTFNFIMKV